MQQSEIEARIAAHFEKTVQKDSKIKNAYLLVYSEQQQMYINLAEGSEGEAPAVPGQPVFMASVGKLFTAVLVARLVEEKRLMFNDAINRFLAPDLLHGMHVYKGQDYTGQIRIRHLLNHTSGLADFFEDKPRRGKPMQKLIFDEPDRFWTPQEVVQWSKENLSAHFPPGKGFHYSDTGYHLLGLIVRHLTGMPFHLALRRYIFEPLEMNQTWLLCHSEPVEKSPYPIAKLYSGEMNVIGFTSLSVDYAGGGIAGPLDDMLKFMQALVRHEILRADTLEQMRDWARFSIGIDYGYGIMNFTTVPLLMPKKYQMWGNAGSTGSFMFYHPGLDAYLIGSLNQFRYHTKGIRLLFKVVDELRNRG